MRASLLSSTFTWLAHGVRNPVFSTIRIYAKVDLRAGGYAFITNMLPLHVFTLLIMGRFTTRIYVAYSVYYAVGTLAAMSVPFVGFQPIRNSEHMSALGVFGLLQLVAFFNLVHSHLPKKQFKRLLTGSLVAGTVLGGLALTVLTQKGWIAPWTGRFYSLCVSSSKSV